MARLIDPDTAQEHIDDAVREAERAADVAIADLRAELEQTQHELRVAQHRAANYAGLEDQWRAASTRILEMQSTVINATTEREALRLRLAALEPVEAAIAALTARNPRITFLPGPGPARLILGTTTIQGLNADAFLRALATLARSITPDRMDTL